MKTMKKSLAMFLAVLCIFTAFGVAGSATDVTIPMTARTADKITFTVVGYDDFQFCVMQKDTPVTGIPDSTWEAWDVQCGSNSVSGKKCWIDVTKSMLTAMFVTGTVSDEYMIYGRREVSTNNYTYAKSDAFRFAPVAPVVTARTENTVTVKAVSDCVYSWTYYNPDTKQFKVGSSGTWTSSPAITVWGTSNVLTNIESGADVAIFTCYSATPGSDIGYSYATHTATSTYIKAPNKPAAPVLESYTKDTISVSLNEAFPVEFSIDGGETWVGNNIKNTDNTYTGYHTFDKLTKNTMYSIIARGAIVEEQLEGQYSEALTVKTAARDIHVSDVYTCTVELPTDEVKTGNKATLTAIGDFLETDVLEGDTRAIPVAWEAKMGTAVIDQGTWNTVAVKQTAEIDTQKAADAKYSGLITVTVTFQVQEYANGTWNNVSQHDSGSTFTAKHFTVPDYLLAVVNAALTAVFTAIGTVFRYLINLVKAK